MAQIQGILDTANIQLRVPAKTKQLGNLFFAVLVRITSVVMTSIASAATGLDDIITDLAQFERLRNLCIRLFVHPFWSRRASPHNDVIVLAQPPAPTEVRVPPMMFARADVRSLQQQQGDHHERTVVAVHHGHIAGGQAPEHRPQQGRFARLFPLVRPDRQVQHAGGRLAKDRHGPSDRQTDAGLLRLGMRIDGLVLRRVGHGKREAVDELGVVLAFPQPPFVRRLLHFLGHFARQFVQRRFGELGPARQ